jgi:hypothetical protein
LLVVMAALASCLQLELADSAPTGTLLRTMTRLRYRCSAQHMSNDGHDAKQ